MTTLANNINIRVLGDKHERLYKMSTAAAQEIFAGVPVILDAEDVTGLVTSDAVTCDTSDAFVGIAEEHIKVALGDANPKITLLTYPSIVGIPSTVFTIADLGKPVYAAAFTATGITLSASVGAYPKLGRLYDVSDGYAWIALDPPYLLTVS